MMWTIYRPSLFFLTSLSLHGAFFYAPSALPENEKGNLFLPVEIVPATRAASPATKISKERRGRENNSFETEAQSYTVSSEEIESYGNNLPEYPEFALKNQIEGVVLIKIKVGTQVEVRVQEPSSEGILNDSVESAIKTWQFPPAFIEKFQGQEFLIPFDFKIKQGE